MHIHDLFSSNSPYSNVPNSNAMEPVRTYIRLDDMKDEISKKIQMGNVTANDGPAVFLLFILNLLSQSTDNTFIYQSEDWMRFLNLIVKPYMRGAGPVIDENIQSLFNSGERFFYLGFPLGFWELYERDWRRADEIELNENFIQNNLNLNMGGNFNQFQNSNFNLKNVSDWNNVILIANIDLKSQLFFDKRMSGPILNPNIDPQLVELFASLLGIASSCKRYYKKILKSQERDYIQILQNMNLIKINKMRELNNLLNNNEIVGIEISYMCPYYRRNMPIIPILTFKPTSKRIDLDEKSCGGNPPTNLKRESEKTKKEEKPSVIVF